MRQVLEMALEALEDIKDDCSGCEFEWSNDYPLQAKAHAAIKEALAQPEQEPVAWTEKVGGIGFKEPMPNANYKVTATIAPQRKPLTDEQMPVGWVFYTSDFSMRAAGKSVKGSVLLVRDEAGRKWWLGLEGNRDSDDFPPLYVGAEGETFEQAIANATDKARAIESALRSKNT